MSFDAADQVFAVWDGRFQPFHFGHLAVIRRILEHFQLPTVVFVIQSSVATPANAYSAEVNPHHAPERNPLTVWERYSMISTALEAERLTAEVRVLGIPRPDLYWAIARSFYPTNRFICLTEKDDYELSKAAFWASLGERVQVVPSADLPKISATIVKESLHRGAGWEDLLHPATIRYFREIGGPARFRAARI
jgi:cytidyltransferase-like protein